MLKDLLMIPVRLAVLLVEIFGRTVVVALGLVAFGVGFVLCNLPFLGLVGAPMCLLSGILVAKAL